MVANEGGEGVTVHPTPFNQETVLDSAKKYIEQVNTKIEKYISEIIANTASQ